MIINWERFFKWIVAFAERWYILIIVLAIITAIAAFPRTKNLYSNIDTDLANLLPSDYESVKTIWKIRDKFKALVGAILVIEGPNEEDTQKVVKKIAAFMEKDPKIGEVTYKKPGYDFFEKNALLFIDLDDLEEIDYRMDRRIQKEKLGGLYIDFEEDDEDKDDEFKFGDIEDKYKKQYSAGARSPYFTSDSRTIYSILLKPTSEKGGIKGHRKFYEHVREAGHQFMKQLNDPRIKLYYTGSVRTRAEEYTSLIRDLARAGIISGCGIALVLLLFFRRIFAVGIMLLPLCFGILSTFAFASFFIDSLNLVTSFLFAILGGLGVEVGIHLVSRYIEERRLGKDIHEALFIVLYHTGGSALTSALTVAASFLILMINDFKGFSEFGFIAGTGLIINYISYMLVLPSLLVLAEKLKLLALKRKIGFEIAPAKITTRRYPRPKFVLIGMSILTLLALIDLPQVQMEWKFKHLKAHNPAHEMVKKKQRLTARSVNSPALVIVHNKEEADAVKKVVKERMKKKGSIINAYKSYYDLFPDDQKKKLEVIDRMHKRLQDDTIKLVKGEHKENLDKFKEQLKKTSRKLKESDVPDDVRTLFWGDDMNEHEQVAYINPHTDLEMDDGRNATRFKEEIGEIKTPLGTFYPSNDALVFADVLHTMIRDGRRAIVLAFICVFIIVFIDFRSLRETVMVISPIALGVLFMTLLMYVFKIKFNFYNMVIAPTVVGTSIDNSVHLYHRYKEMGRTHLMDAVRSTGGAAFLSSATNICGFVGLVFVNHAGLRSIGNLAVLGMFACLTTTLIFFPALIQFLEDRKNKKARAS